MLAAQRGLRERHVEPRHEVLAVALEARVRLDHHEHVQVARRGSAIARMAMAREPHALTVIDAGGDVDVQAAGLHLPARSAAQLAWRLRDAAVATAAVAGLGANHLAEHRACHRLQLARALAPGTSLDRGARLGAVAVAAGAVRGDLELDVLCAPVSTSSSVRETCTATSRPRSGPPRPRPPKTLPNGSPPPKKASKMSEMLPKPLDVGCQPPERTPSCP